jgi:RHS repeat-associated protein
MALTQLNLHYPKAKAYCIPALLSLAAIIGIVAHIQEMNSFLIVGLLLNILGVFICAMLMQKQLMGESRYGDRVCNLFHHADCNSILDGPKAKIFSISWSEVGMGYFTASILLITLYPESVGTVSIINWIAMFYGVWSIYYQWRITKSWCVLCVISQIIIWLIGIISIISCISVPLTFNVFSSLLSYMVYGICIMAVHHYAITHTAEKERIRAVQKYRTLKANSKVASALIENGEYYETSLEDSSILFGNTEAKMRVTILSNPHCNPCARMHKHVENLLRLIDGRLVSHKMTYSHTNKPVTSNISANLYGGSFDAKGVVQQVTNYYPFGVPYADASATLNPSLQAYKYNGKELELMHGLNTYDHGARQNDPMDRMDPLCERDYKTIPYAYCMNNPVRFVDPNGMWSWPWERKSLISYSGNGTFRLNISNFSASTRNTFNRMNNDPHYWKVGEIGINTEVGKIHLDSPKSYTATHKPVGIEEKQMTLNIGVRNAVSTGMSDRRFKPRSISPVSGAKGAGAMLAVDIAVTAVDQYQMLSSFWDSNALENQTQSLNDAFYAVQNNGGLIPDKYKDDANIIGAVVNYVFQGVNSTKNNDVKK